MARTQIEDHTYYLSDTPKKRRVNLRHQRKHEAKWNQDMYGDHDRNPGGHHSFPRDGSDEGIQVVRNLITGCLKLTASILCLFSLCGWEGMLQLWTCCCHSCSVITWCHCVELCSSLSLLHVCYILIHLSLSLPISLRNLQQMMCQLQLMYLANRAPMWQRKAERARSHVSEIWRNT